MPIISGSRISRTKSVAGDESLRGVKLICRANPYPPTIIMVRMLKRIIRVVRLVHASKMTSLYSKLWIEFSRFLTPHCFRGLEMKPFDFLNEWQDRPLCRHFVLFEYQRRQEMKRQKILISIMNEEFLFDIVHFFKSSQL